MNKALYFCERCAAPVFTIYGSGRFCSRSCANSRPERSKQSRNKTSLSLKAYNKTAEVTSRKRHIEYLARLECYLANPSYCNICGKQLDYKKKHLKTCGDPDCVKKQISLASKHTHDNIPQKVLGRHIVYKVINDIDNRYYIGVRKTASDSFDGYLGSGVHIRRMVHKYGKNHFQRLTLYEFDNSGDAYRKESELLNDALTDPDCVNLANGGKGGATFKGKHHSEATRQKISDKARQRNRTPEVKAYIAQRNREVHSGVPNVNKGRIYINNGYHNTTINSEDLQAYLEQGYVKGKLKRV